jgi:hypothetical protein
VQSTQVSKATNRKRDTQFDRWAKAATKHAVNAEDNADMPGLLLGSALRASMCIADRPGAQLQSQQPWHKLTNT